VQVIVVAVVVLTGRKIQTLCQKLRGVFQLFALMNQYMKQDFFHIWVNMICCGNF